MKWEAAEDRVLETELVKVMNARGAEGWEPIHVQHTRHPVPPFNYSNWWHVVYRRPVKETS